MVDVSDTGGERVLRIFDPGSSKTGTPSVDQLAAELQKVHVGDDKATTSRRKSSQVAKMER